MTILTTSNVAATVARQTVGGGAQPQIRDIHTDPQPARAAVAVSPPPPPVQTPAAAQELEQVQQAIERMKQSIKPELSNTLEFQVDQSSGRTLIRIMDAETQTIVRQIPSQEMLEIAQAIDRMQGRSGLVKQQV